MSNDENYYYCNFHMKETLIMFIEEHKTYVGHLIVKFGSINESDQKCCCSKVINYIGRDCTAPVRWVLFE